MKLKRIFAVVTAALLFCGAFARTFAAIADELPTLRITADPLKTEYLEGDRFDSFGLAAELVFADGSSEPLGEEDIAYTAADNLMPNVHYYAVYQLGLPGLSAELPINVRAKSPKTLTVKTPPTKKTYIEGNTFDKTGMALAVLYDNGVTAAVTDPAKYTISPSVALKTTDKEIIVSYSENNKTVTAKTAITVNAKKLSSIAITTKPTKTAYIEANTFDKAGLVVTATYDNGTKAAVTSYTLSPTAATALKTTDTGVTISYIEDGITKTAVQAITVAKKSPTAIAITTKPTKTAYIEGETFSKTGMVVTATYNNGTKAAVTAYTFSPTAALKLTDKTITVSYPENGVTKTATLAITIQAKPTAIKFGTASTTLGVGESYATAVTITPSGAVSARTYTSSNTKIATVDSAGKIKALAAGSATITVKTTYNAKSATFTVTVKPALTKIAYKTAGVTLGVGESYATGVTVTPSNAKSTRTYTSGNTKAATVDSAGKIKAVAVGTSKIQVTTYNGKTATFTVTVKAAPAKVTLSKTAATIAKGKTLTLTATLPANTAGNVITWTSSNTKIATVSGGKITAVAKGTATITVKTFNGKTATCKITVS
ncbi:MAG: Ig-like domain-containing protein [Oscillospiraceae bacterium]|jgi:uncharacterized protein YjdB|nr:Ig-like domain-containing protein [Oscillospiraceae bacterium]